MGEEVGRPKGVADEDETCGLMVSVDVFGGEILSSLTDKPLTVTAFTDSIIGLELLSAATEEFGSFSSGKPYPFCSMPSSGGNGQYWEGW